MVKELISALILCTSLYAADGQSPLPPQSPIPGEESPVPIPEIPEYIVTQHPFPTFSNLKNTQSQTQVFSICNTDTTPHTYTLEIKSDSPIHIDLTKRGDSYYQGEIPATPLTLTTLAPEENQVFTLTLTATQDTPEITLNFQQE